MEGGIGFGLGHALYGEITLDKGKPVQTNFDSYRSLRFQEMPQVEVAIIASTEKPTASVSPRSADRSRRGQRAGPPRPRPPRQLPMVGGTVCRQPAPATAWQIAGRLARACRFSRIVRPSLDPRCLLC